MAIHDAPLALPSTTESVVPSWPMELMLTTSDFPEGVPWTPARNTRLWVPTVPMRMVPLSAEAPGLAMSTLSEPVVLSNRASEPVAAPLPPLVLALSAS